MTHFNELSEPSEKAITAVETARLKAKETLQKGVESVRANPVPAAIGALIIGIALGALLTPRPRKPVDRIQNVRDWLEDSLSELSKVKKHAGGLQSKVCDQASELGHKLKFW